MWVLMPVIRLERKIVKLKRNMYKTERRKGKNRDEIQALGDTQGDGGHPSRSNLD